MRGIQQKIQLFHRSFRGEAVKIPDPVFQNRIVAALRGRIRIMLFQHFAVAHLQGQAVTAMLNFSHPHAAIRFYGDFNIHAEIRSVPLGMKPYQPGGLTGLPFRFRGDGMQHFQSRAGVAAQRAESYGHFHTKHFRAGKRHIVNLAAQPPVNFRVNTPDFSTNGVIGLRRAITDADGAGAAERGLYFRTQYIE